MSRISRTAIVAIGLVCSLICGTTMAGEPTDRIYFGGPIVTVDDANPRAEAVAIRDGRIIAVGDQDDVMSLASATTEKVDLKGHTLIPGFIDGHAHFYAFGAQAIGANLLAKPDGHVDTMDQLVDTLNEWSMTADLNLSDGWIFGLGYDDAILGRHPTAEDLDKVSREHPVIAIHISGHFSAVNSVGLARVFQGRTPEDPTGGKIHRKPGTNEPNGTLEEAANFQVVFPIISPKDYATQKIYLEKAQDLAMRFGYTTAHEGRTSADQHEAMVMFAEEGLFEIDVVSYPDYTDVSPLSSPWYSPDRNYQHHYRVGGVKITLDGSPQGRTAWRSTPYAQPPPGEANDYSGYRVVDDAVVNTVFDQAYAKNWQILAHANGDAAIDQMIAAVKAATRKHGLRDRRPVLIHGQFVTLEQLDELAALRVIPSLFPMHTFYWGDWYRTIIGEDAAQKISPIRSALQRTGMVTSHTDAPIALPNLLQVMWATVNRESRSGQIIGEGEKLTPLEALKAVTLWGAYQHFEERSKGSIQVGKLADLVILSGNPVAEGEEKTINQIVVLETIKEGETVYRATP